MIIGLSRKYTKLHSLAVISVVAGTAGLFPEIALCAIELLTSLDNSRVFYKL
jgi:hypothetical protein